MVRSALSLRRIDESNVRGYVGEVGWPADGDVDRWNRVAEVWLADVEAAGPQVTTWATGEWRDEYPLSPYVASRARRPVDNVRPQGALLSWHTEHRYLALGVNVSGGEFGAPGGTEQTSSFSNRNPGEADRDYRKDAQATFDFLAERGLHLVRLPFRWERLQPELGGALDPEESARLLAAVARADRAGLQVVVIHMHNYGGYMLDDGGRGVRRAVGSPEVMRWHLRTSGAASASPCRPGAASSGTAR